MSSFLEHYFNICWSSFMFKIYLKTVSTEKIRLYYNLDKRNIHWKTRAEKGVNMWIKLSNSQQIKNS